MSKISLKIKNITFIFFILAGALIWTEALFLSQDYLVTNPYWYSYKNVLEKTGMMGALSTGMSRTLLAGNQINLNAGYGHQEVYNTSKATPVEIRGRVVIPDSSYVDILFNSSINTYEGVRLSRSPLYPSMNYRSERSGVFYEKNLLPELKDLEKNLSFILKQEGSGLTLFIDDLPPIKLKSKFYSGEFGFKSGLLGAHVKDLEVQSDDHTIETAFRLYPNYTYVFIIVLDVLIVAGLIFAIAVKLFSHSSYLKAFHSVSLFIMLAGLFWLGFDYLYYSRLDQSWDTTINSAVSSNKKKNFKDFETLRYMGFAKVAKTLGFTELNHKLFTDRFGLQLKDRQTHITTGAGAKTIRMAMFGGSFSAGGGVEQIYPTFFEILHKEVAAKKGSANVESTNFSRDNWRLKNHSNEVIELILKNKFTHIVVMNALHADNEHEENKQIEEVFKTAQSVGSKVIYVAGVKNIERDLFSQANVNVRLVNIVNELGDYNLQKQKFFASIKDKYQVTRIDPSVIISNVEVAQTGSLWWDVVHLSAYGNKLMGDYLGREVLAEMEKLP